MIPSGDATSFVLQEPKFLTADQFVLTTLVVKLAAMAALGTMLARYRRFRHILIFEQRNWPDRLVFALGLALPFTAGVASRVLLNYDAADLTLEGALLAGLIAGPYTGAIVGLSMSLPALTAGSPSRFAVFDVEDRDALVRRGPSTCVATVVGGRLVHRRR